jgi:hypothetical protein
VSDPPEPPAPALPSPRRRRFGFWLGAAILIVVLAGGAAVSINGYLSTPGPEQVVRAYFAAVARGDAESALSYGDVPAGDHSYLTADVLQQQLANGAITSVHTSRTSTSGVSVSYLIAGKEVDDVVPVVKRGGRWWLQASAIRISVSLSVAAERATFAGTALPTGQPLVFPGALPIRFDTPALAIAPTAGVARFAATTSSALAVNVSTMGQRAVATAIVDALTACVTSTSPAALCPVPVGTGVRAVPASLRGRITEPPQITTTVAPQSDGQLLITGSEAVEGSYQNLDYENQTIEKTGQFTVLFSARSYATSPADFAWNAP